MLKTTYKIFDSPAGKTIIFNNLYFINGEFIFNGSTSSAEISTYPNVHYRHTNFELWKPSITQLPEDNAIPTIETTHFYLKETLHGHAVHTLVDDVFSVFYSLNRCNLDYNPCVCILEMSESYNKTDFYDCNGKFKCLFGSEAISSHHLERTYSKVCFQTFVVGNGDSGLHSYDSNYAAPFKNNIWKQFRDEFYKKAKINLESGNKIIYTDSNNFPIKNELKTVLEKNNIPIIHWGGHIKDQLNILKDVKIYISTEGADMINSIFLPDNAMVIDLGRMYACDTYKALGYCVDWIFPSIFYIDVFYFEDYYVNYHRAQETTPNSDDLIQMIENLNDEQKKNHILLRRAEVYDSFASKIVDKINCDLKLNNYSPNARLLIENHPSTEERTKITEDFKRGNTAYACNDKIRPFRAY